MTFFEDRKSSKLKFTSQDSTPKAYIPSKDQEN